MANLAMLDGKITSTNRKNIERLLDAINQRGEIWVGRGAWLYITDEIICEDNLWSCEVHGETKWSIRSSLYDNAESLKRKNPICRLKGIENISFVNLSEACEMFECSIELYSEECGMCFAEHIIYDYNKHFLSEECVDYAEYEIADMTREEAQEAHNIEIPEELWNRYIGEDWLCVGGYEEHSYSI